MSCRLSRTSRKTYPVSPFLKNELSGDKHQADRRPALVPFVPTSERASNDRFSTWVDAASSGQRAVFDLNAPPPGDIASTSQTTDPQSLKPTKTGRRRAPDGLGEFAMRSYPLDTTSLRHFYDNDHLVPLDFETFMTNTDSTQKACFTVRSQRS